MCTVREKLEISLIETIKNNETLMVHDANEITISHAISSEMSKQFPNCDVDPEYNRFGAEQRTKIISMSRKRFLQYKAQGVVPSCKMTIDELYQNPEKAPVFPDIIVHIRTEEFNNLLIVEVKKENNPELFDGWDEWKIQFFMEVFQYQHGAQVVLKTTEKLDHPESYISNINFWP